MNASAMKIGARTMIGVTLLLLIRNISHAWAELHDWHGIYSTLDPAMFARVTDDLMPTLTAFAAGLGMDLPVSLRANYDGPDRRATPPTVPPAAVGAVLLLMFCAAPVFAQSAAITSYSLQVYNPGVNPATGMPFQTNVIPAASVTCNQTKPTVPPNVVNPTQIFWDDTANAGKACIVDQSAFLLALPVPTPFGQYVATVIATNAGGNSPRSAASNPFSRILAPPAQTGLSVF